MEEKKYEISIQEVDNMFVAIVKNLRKQVVERIFNLNETGALMLKALLVDHDKSAIISLLMSEYTIHQQQAESEVSDFINMLNENGLMEIVENGLYYNHNLNHDGY